MENPPNAQVTSSEKEDGERGPQRWQVILAEKPPLRSPGGGTLMLSYVYPAPARLLPLEPCSAGTLGPRQENSYFIWHDQHCRSLSR